MRLGSITNAGYHLNIAQSRVSSHIKSLETELGTQLLDRSRRPARPTPFGVELARTAAHHVEALDSLRSSARESESELPVTVVAQQGLIASVLFEVVSGFKERWPGSSLRLRSYSTGQEWRFVTDAGVDLALVLNPSAHEDLEYTPLFNYDRVLLAPLGHPVLQHKAVKIEQIAKWPLILTERGRHTRELIEAEFLKAGVSYELAMEVPNLEMAKPYVERGMGIAVGTSLNVTPTDHGRVGVVGLSEILQQGEVVLVKERGRTLSNMAQRFFDLVVENLKES